MKIFVWAVTATLTALGILTYFLFIMRKLRRENWIVRRRGPKRKMVVIFYHPLGDEGLAIAHGIYDEETNTIEAPVFPTDLCHIEKICGYEPEEANEELTFPAPLRFQTMPPYRKFGKGETDDYG